MRRWILRIRVIDKDFFNAIEQRIKTVETRAATKKYENIKPGDILVFVCDKRKLERKVRKVSFFRGINELIKKIPLERIMPFVDSLSKAKRIWYGFPNYEDKIKKFGLIALELE